MSTKVLNGPIKCLTTTGVAAGILSSSSADAQLLTATPNASLSTNSNLYFNVSTPNLAFSTSNSGATGEVKFEGPDVKATPPGDPAGAYKDFGSELTTDATLTSINLNFANPALAPGSTVDATTVNGTTETDELTFTPGTSTYGFSLVEDDATTHYGYITLTQTGSFDPASGATPDYADIVNTIAIDETANEGVLIPLDANDVAVPEPSTFGLLAAAGAGLAGLSLYRRARKA
jgi:hypothetical protein